MNITITFDTSNAAFNDNHEEIAFVLAQAKDIIHTNNFDKPLRDSNGNKVGSVCSN